MTYSLRPSFLIYKIELLCPLYPEVIVRIKRPKHIQQLLVQHTCVWIGALPGYHHSSPCIPPSLHLPIFPRCLRWTRSFIFIFQATVTIPDTSQIVKKCFLNKYKNNVTIKKTIESVTYVTLTSEIGSSRIGSYSE